MRFLPAIGLGLILASGSVACDQLGQASQLAEFTMYYAVVGTQIGNHENQFEAVNQQVVAALQDPAQRPNAIASLRSHIDGLQQIVDNSRGNSSETNAGYQAALTMVQTRRQALAQFEPIFLSATDPTVAMQAYSAFSQQYNGALQTFMMAVGQQAQTVFGQAGNTALQNNIPGAQPGVPMQPGMMPPQPGMQPGMMPPQPGMPMQPGMMPPQPGMPMQPGMMPPQPGMPMQPGMMPPQPGMPMQPGMMPPQPPVQQ